MKTNQIIKILSFHLLQLTQHLLYADAEFKDKRVCLCGFKYDVEAERAITSAAKLMSEYNSATRPFEL